MSHNITVEGGSSVRLPTSGKYCDRDIIVTATGEDVVLQSKSVTPTEAIQEVTADEGYTALEKVTVEAIPSEYIVPSGDLAITENGTFDVTQYASAEVNVPSEEPVLQEKSVTENGEVTADEGYDGLSKVTVNVEAGDSADSAVPAEVSTEAEMTALLESGEIGGVYKYVGKTGTYVNNTLYVLKNASTLTTSDGYYVTDADGTALVTKGDAELAKLTDREDLTEYFEFKHETVSLPYAGRIKMYAFYRDGVLKHIEMPNVAVIESNAFNFCYRLAITELPSGLTSIGAQAFYGCDDLALTELPSGLTSIGYAAFYQCFNILLSELPSGLTSIGELAFFDCMGLTITELPSGLTSIGNRAFRWCSGLTSITFKSTPTSIGTDIFEGCNKLTTINVPWAKGTFAEAEAALFGAENATINYGKLSAPALSLDGSVLTITDNDDRATSFDILIDGEVNTTVTATTFDLSTLGLASGTYNITAIAKADGLTDSSESVAVEYTVS